MEYLGHNFIFIPCGDRNKFRLNEIDHFYECQTCKLLIFKIINEEECYYLFRGIGKNNIVNITCDENIIKKLLE